MSKNKKLSFHIIANAALGPGLSGGDRIFIELARRWSRDHKVTIYVWEEGYDMCKRNGLENVNYVIWSASKYKKLGFPVHYFVRTVKGCLAARRLKTVPSNADIIYSASDFWPDSLPSFIMKNCLPDARLISTFYLTAPNPFRKESPYRGKGLLNFLKGLFYYFMQRPIYKAIRKRADMVFVTSEPDREKFVDQRLTPDRVIAVRGGVDTKLSESVLEPIEKQYDAVFVGRFHPQKGLLELVDIWEYVVHKRPEAKLAIIGIGSLENELREKIRQRGLGENIKLLGFKDGLDKIKIFKSSRIVVHPAIYDSGGMAPAEAMAAGLPGVSFDLEALKTYYPKGMLKTPCFDVQAFAKNVLELLEDRSLYEETKRDALDWAKEWGWNKRARDIMRQIEAVLVTEK
jgi:glycosyltransferase involved in cell wall biosynthesis